MAGPTPYETGATSQYNEATGNYATYAAGQDPAINAPALALSNKLTGGTELVTVLQDLGLVLQRMMSQENGGATFAGAVQSQIGRTGVPAYGMSGSVGMIQGSEVVTAQAAKALHQEVMKSFVHPVTGVPTAKAHGLDQGELGRLAAQIIANGGASRGGPMFQHEVMTPKRIEDLQREGRAVRDSGGNTALLDEANSLTVGQSRISLTKNVKQVTQALEDGAATLAAVREVMTSAGLKDLDATSQLLFGGPMVGGGERAARLRMSHIKATAATSFDGNLKEAAIFSNAGVNLMTEGLGSEAQRHLAVSVAQAADNRALAGQRSSSLDQGALSAYGINVRPRGAAEIQNTSNAALATYANQEEGAIALAHYMSKLGGNASVGDKAAAERAFRGISEAGADEGKYRQAVANMDDTVLRLTGQSRGTYLANNGGVMGARENTRGEYSDRTGAMLVDLLDARNQGMQADQFRNDTSLAKGLKLSAEEMAVGGMGAVNLSGAQLSELMEKVLKVENPRARAEEIDKFVNQDGVKASLGADSAAFGQFLAQRGTPARLAALRGMPKNAATLDFVGRGDRAYEDQRVLDAYITQNQDGRSLNSGNLAQEFLKGMMGDKPISDNALIERARRDKAGLTQLGMKDNRVEASDANAAALAKTLSEKALADVGLKVGDTAGIKAALADPLKAKTLLEAMQNEGTWIADKNQLTYMDAATTEAQRRGAEDESRNTLLKQMGGEGFERQKKDDGTLESDAEAAARFRKRLNTTLSLAERTRKTSEGGWSLTDKVVARHALGDTDMLDGMLRSGALDQGRREALLGAVKLQQQDINDRSNAERDQKVPDPQKLNALAERRGRLDTLMESLKGGADSAQTSSMTVNVAGDVVVTNNGSRSK